MPRNVAKFRATANVLLMRVEIAVLRMRHLFGLMTNDLLGTNTMALTGINQKCCQEFCTCTVSASIRRFALHR
ncbi:MAG: hypothetical protein KDJ48_06950, partial [Nitratireductor sp.]|nr:hypothetical protein [Nitratireductor sp.]